MSLRFAVVHEADADFRIATELADRIFLDSIKDWLDEEQLHHQREWVSHEPQGQRLSWTAIPELAGKLRIRAHGHIDGRPLEPDAGAARRAILYLKAMFDELDGILLIRDCDDQLERGEGLEQARKNDRSDVALVIGFAIVERESWVLSGFEPQNQAEQSNLDSERKMLGFNPCESSHELTAGKDNTAKRSPKRVLRALSGGDFDRERRCWTETPLSLLSKRGQENGLAAYLDEVRDRLAPLIGHVEKAPES